MTTNTIQIILCFCTDSTTKISPKSHYYNSGVLYSTQRRITFRVCVECLDRYIFHGTMYVNILVTSRILKKGNFLWPILPVTPTQVHRNFYFVPLYLKTLETEIWQRELLEKSNKSSSCIYKAAHVWVTRDKIFDILLLNSTFQFYLLYLPHMLIEYVWRTRSLGSYGD